MGNTGRPEYAALFVPSPLQMSGNWAVRRAGGNRNPFDPSTAPGPEAEATETMGRHEIGLGGATAAILLLALLIGLTFSPGASAHAGTASELFERAMVDLVPYTPNPGITVDGAILPGEYSAYGAWTDASTGLSVDWLWDGSSVFVAVSDPTPGWVALGLSSDLEQGMGFVVLGEVNGSFHSVVRFTANVSDEAVLVSPTPGTDVVRASSITRQNGGLTAEVQLAANSTLWDLRAGELVPTVVAFNETSAKVPSTLAGSQVRFLRSYFLRPQDNPAEIQKLFMEQISPVPGLVGVGVMGVGVTAILATFVRRKGAS